MVRDLLTCPQLQTFLNSHRGPELAQSLTRTLRWTVALPKSKRPRASIIPSRGTANTHPLLLGEKVHRTPKLAGAPPPTPPRPGPTRTVATTTTHNHDHGYDDHYCSTNYELLPDTGRGSAAALKDRSCLPHVLFECSLCTAAEGRDSDFVP